MFKQFLNWCSIRLWKKSKSDKSFKIKCKNFYFHKTQSRLKQFFKNNKLKSDIFNRINNEKVPKIETLLKRIDFESLYEGKSTFIHGDLQFDNILMISKKNFKLIDWRSDFGGLIIRGDLYYDLSKLYGGILINYKRPQATTKNLRYKKILQFLKFINTNSSEIILFDKNSILEGCTTNIICVKNKKLYIPKKNYYFGFIIFLGLRTLSSVFVSIIFFSLITCLIVFPELNDSYAILAAASYPIIGASDVHIARLPSI